MALDAVICGVRRVGREIELELVPRIGRDGRLSCAGQTFLRIVKGDYLPKCGEKIWGGAGFARIGDVEYKRVGYVKLEEKTSTGDAGEGGANNG